MEERNESQCIGRIWEQPEVCDELVLGSCLQVIAGFGPPVLHGVFFHARECGIRIGFGIGVMFSESIQVIVVFRRLVTVSFKFLEWFLLFTEGFPLFLADAPGLL